MAGETKMESRIRCTPLISTPQRTLCAHQGLMQASLRKGALGYVFDMHKLPDECIQPRNFNLDMEG
jgi:hypothetical protein